MELQKKLQLVERITQYFEEYIPPIEVELVLHSDFVEVHHGQKREERSDT